jgi:hypothetical protein
MTLTQILDVLSGGSFRYLETKDGGKYGGEALAVNFCSDYASPAACIDVDEEGLSLHFNTRANGGMEAVTINFNDIAVVRS